MKALTHGQQTVPSHDDNLRVLVGYLIEPILRRPHLNPDTIIGFIGDRGGGKSLGSGLVCLLDYMLDGMTLRSNMDVRCSISVDDETAQAFGLKEGGTVRFQSEELDKRKFLSFDPEYAGCCVLIEEINVWLADARRSMSGQNLMADDVGQQLRKLKMPLVYNCINEMFVDSRIRDLTDLFIHTSDTALTRLGLSRQQQQGLEFAWYLYPMTPKITGEKYADTRQRLGPYYIRGKPLWGLVETFKRQERRKGLSMADMSGVGMDVDYESDPANTTFNSKYGWVADKLNTLIGAGIDFVGYKERMSMFPNVPNDVLREEFGLCWDGFRQGYTFGYCNPQK